MVIKRMLNFWKIPKIPYDDLMQYVTCFMCDSFNMDMKGQKDLSKADYTCKTGDFGRLFPCSEILRTIEKGVKKGWFNNKDGRLVKDGDTYIRIPNDHRLRCKEYETLIDVWRGCFEHDFTKD